MTTEQTDCRHANFDDYFNSCPDCGLKPEVCENCLSPLTVEEVEHEYDFVAKLCADCKDYNRVTEVTIEEDK